MSAYHEKVARIMKASVMAGTLNSYDEILAALYRRFPDECELRAYVVTLVSVIRETAPGFDLEDLDPER